MDFIRLAIPKGDAAISAILRNMGYLLPEDFDESRKYIVPVEGANMEFILSKPIDIPTYVEYGVADVGIAGKDILLENDRDVYELLDLGVQCGSISVIGRSKTVGAHPKVATRYPKIASKYYKEKGMQAHIVTFSGGMELSLLTGTADCVIEVYDRAFSDLNFVEIEKICRTSSRLIANRASFQVKHASIQSLIEKFQRNMRSNQ